jgi:hypothetical protein
MKTDPFPLRLHWIVRLRARLLVAAACLLAAACATIPDTPSVDAARRARAAAQLDRSSSTPEALLGYYQALSPMSATDLLRERRLLSQLGSAADTQLRQAMVLGHPRQPNPDLARANSILEQLLQSSSADVHYLRPIIHLLADSYAERLRQESRLSRQGKQMEKQYQRLLESQRQASELRNQLEGLANIERSLAPRSSRPIHPSGKP